MASTATLSDPIAVTMTTDGPCRSRIAGSTSMPLMSGRR
jgi:hypothetical protein